LPHRGRFLALAGAEVIELGAAGPAFLFHLDFRDSRRMKRKHALDSFPIGNPADGERFVQSASFPANDNAGKNLDPLLIAFDDASMHADAIANLEFGDIGFELFLLDSVNNPVHNEILPALQPPRSVEAWIDSCFGINGD